MIKENIVSLVDGFTVELNPKVRHKLKSIPLDKKNNVYITYLPDATAVSYTHLTLPTIRSV